MPSSPPAIGLSIPGGQWTQVEWYTGTFGLQLCFTAPREVEIGWRWFSVGFPPVWGGSFRSIAQITLPAGFYTSLEFNPSLSTIVRRVASPC
jgi:hypothetical protein